MYPIQPTILIADDDRVLRETLADLFAPRGYRAITAEDGPCALTIVEREPVHLLLLDMHMPRWTGLDTIQAVRRIHAQLPFILMSAALDQRILQQAQQADAFTVLSKPLSAKSLTDNVDEALRQTYGWTRNG